MGRTLKHTIHVSKTSWAYKYLKTNLWIAKLAHTVARGIVTVLDDSLK